MKSLIIGLGNPIMGDDAIGCVCAQAIKEVLDPMDLDGVEVDQFYRGGISLMERLIGYDRALIIDAINDSGKSTGSVTHLSLDDIPSFNSNSPHDGSFKIAIDFGRKMGEHLPLQIDLLAIEIEPKFEFSEKLSAEVNCCIEEVICWSRDWIRKENAFAAKNS